MIVDNLFVKTERVQTSRHIAERENAKPHIFYLFGGGGGGGGSKDLG